MSDGKYLLAHRLTRLPNLEATTYRFKLFLLIGQEVSSEWKGSSRYNTHDTVTQSETVNLVLELPFDWLWGFYTQFTSAGMTATEAAFKHWLGYQVLEHFVKKHPETRLLSGKGLHVNVMASLIEPFLTDIKKMGLIPE